MLRISWSTAEEGVVFSEDGSAESEIVFTENTLEFDCVTSETHDGTSTVTEHAIESNAPISDHKYHNPRRLTIEALVTNTPLGAPPSSGYGDGVQITGEVREAGEDEPGAAQRPRASVVVFSADFDRMADVADTLDRLRIEATPVTITTRVRTYEDVQIASVLMPREPDDGDTLRLTIECVEVRIAQSRTVDSPAPREPRGGRVTDRGGREGSEPGSRSVLASARDEYAERREAGDSRTDAATGALGALFGG